MRIHGAALVNRFYVNDGWTREAVAKLLKRPKYPESLEVVVLRHTFESPLEQTTGSTTDDGEPYYYAVYDKSAIFDKEKVKQHEYVPFRLVSSGKIYNCDKTFDTKNRWE